MKLSGHATNIHHMIPTISDKEFDERIGQFQIPVLIEFWKPGCSHCLSLSKELDLLQAEVLHELKIFKMNVEENHIIPADLEIHSLPALALFIQGEFQQSIGGIGTKDELLKQLSPWITPNTQ